MTTRPLTLAFLSVALLAGCASSAPEDVTNEQTPPTSSLSADGNVGAACRSYEDCETPTGYLVRSSCPFTSLCIAGRCAVVCPMADTSQGGSNDWTKPMSCQANTDCDCGSYVSAERGRCACVNKACVAVVEE
jgi:hypothetical protein